MLNFIFHVMFFGQKLANQSYCSYICHTRTRQASSQCLNRRVVFFMKFIKQYASPAELLTILQDRGLELCETVNSEAILRSIGYYRLSGYLYPFLEQPKSTHVFKPGSSLLAALKLYEFDRKLRMLVFDQIERIEIAVRSAIVNITCAETHDVFWMTNSTYFAHSHKFEKTMSLIDKELQNSHEDFVSHFRHTYEEPYPPSWMLAEILPLGTLTRIYDNIANNHIRKKIAQNFGLSVPVFISWMTVVTLTRNSCCHHARLWNRCLTLRTLVMTKPSRPWVSAHVQQGRIFFTLCIIKHLVDVAWPQNRLKQELITLLTNYPSVDIAAMGFPQDWLAEPLWGG